MVILDATVVNVALPTIQRDVGFSEQSLSWVLNAYTLMFGGFLLLGGRLADRLGRRRLFMAVVPGVVGGSPLFGGFPFGGLVVVSLGGMWPGVGLGFPRGAADLLPALFAVV